MQNNNQEITLSPEFIEFCKNNNLEISNTESINLMFYTIVSELGKTLKLVHDLGKENNELREMIMEAVKLIQAPTQIDIRTGMEYRSTLFDKWNNK